MNLFRLKLAPPVRYPLNSHRVPSQSSHILILQFGDPSIIFLYPSCATMTTFVNAHRHVFLPRDEDEVDCSEGGGDDRFLGLRIGSIFIILACATCGALFPVIAKRSSCLHLPRSAYAYALLFPLLSRCTETDYFVLGSPNTLDRVSL